MQQENKDVEKSVKEFYNNFGWINRGGRSGEDKQFREFSPGYDAYHEAVDKRTFGKIKSYSGQVLIAGCGDMPDTHVRVAEHFETASCLDISDVALDIAREKLAGKGKYLAASMLNIPEQDNTYDLVYCSHVVYHIDKDLQETAVREMLRVLKPGGRLVVLYGNPSSWPARFVKARDKFAQFVLGLVRSESSKDNSAPNGDVNDASDDWVPLYYHPHELSWWQRYNEAGALTILPWDVMTARQEKKFGPFRVLSTPAYSLFAWVERKYPQFAARNWSLNIVLIDKH